MRASVLWVVLLLTSCLQPVEERSLPDAGRDGGGAGSSDAGRVDLSCGGDAGAGPWCVDLPGTLWRCAEAELFGCSTLTVALVQGEGALAWISFDLGTRRSEVWVRRLDGAAPALLATGAELNSLAIRAGFAWWIEGGAVGSVRRTPLVGGRVETIASPLDSPRWLAVEGAFVYWVERGDLIQRAPVGGGAPQLFLSNTADPHGLTTDATHLYWGSGTTGSIRRAPLAGGAPEVVFSGQPLPWRLQRVGGLLYWSSDDARGDIRRGSLDGGSAQVVAAEQDIPRDFAADETHLYWVAGGQNFGQPTPRMFSVRLDGGSPELILTPTRGGRIALDARHLYFGGGNIYRFPR